MCPLFAFVPANFLEKERERGSLYAEGAGTVYTYICELTRRTAHRPHKSFSVTKK